MSRIFLIPKADGTQRLILNLRELNEFVVTERFKLEDYRVAKRLVSPGYFTASVDLKDAHQLVPVAQTYRKLLWFDFKASCYKYTCLPYGLSSALYVFTKVIKPVVAYLRSRGFFIGDLFG